MWPCHDTRSSMGGGGDHGLLDPSRTQRSDRPRRGLAFVRSVRKRWEPLLSREPCS